MKNFILLAFLSAFGIYIVKNLQAVNKISTSIVGIDFKGGLLDLKLVLTLNIHNPTEYDINFQKLNAGVYINNDLIGDIDYSSPIILTNNTYTLLDIPIFLNPLYATSRLISNLTAGATNIDIKGKLKAEGFSTGYYETYKLT